MNVLDIVIILLLVIGIWRGLQTGAVKQIAQVVGIIVALALAIQTMKPIGVIIGVNLAISEQYAPLIGFVTVFVVIYVLIYIFFKVIEKILNALMLGSLDKLLGGVIGAFKIALTLSVVFVVMGHFGVPDRTTRLESTLYRPIESIAPGTWAVLSKAIPEAKEMSDKVGERLNPRPEESP